jgi:hypothetical protein
MKYLVIYIEYELIIPFQFHTKVSFLWFHKKYCDEVYHSNKHKCVEKRSLLKINVIWKNRIMLEAFVSKFILYVY